MKEVKRPECYREGKGEYPLCTGNGGRLCKYCQLWEDYPDNPDEPPRKRDYTRVDEIVPGTTVSFLRRQKNFYVPCGTKGHASTCRIVEDFDTGERVFITVDSSGEIVTDVKTEEEMENERKHPRLFGDTVTL